MCVFVCVCVNTLPYWLGVKVKVINKNCLAECLTQFKCPVESAYPIQCCWYCCCCRYPAFAEPVSEVGLYYPSVERVPIWRMGVETGLAKEVSLSFQSCL